MTGSLSFLKEKKGKNAQAHINDLIDDYTLASHTWVLILIEAYNRFGFALKLIVLIFWFAITGSRDAYVFEIYPAYVS